MSYTKENARYTCKERRNELSLRLKVMATWDMNYTALAKEFGVSRQQISKDVRQCISEVHREDLLEVCHNVKRTIEEALRVSMRLLRSDNDVIRARGVHAAVEASVAYMRLMTDISEDPNQSRKLSIEEINRVMEYRSRKEADDPATKIPVVYDNLDWQRSAAQDSNGMLPQPQYKPTGEPLDDLEKVTDEKSEEEENPR